jgi:hypothetical protein
MALSFYTSVARELVVGSVWDWVANTINIWLATNAGYTFSAAHDKRDDLAGEVSGTNYSAGGLALDNKTASAANPTVMTANDEVIAQSGAGFSNGRKYILTKITGGAASTDPLLCYGAAAGDFGNVAGQLTLDIPASFITLTVAISMFLLPLSVMLAVCGVPTSGLA